MNEDRFEKYEKEQHRHGQKAELFPKDCPVVSADLYNTLVDKFNRLVDDYDEVVWIYEDLC